MPVSVKNKEIKKDVNFTSAEGTIWLDFCLVEM